MKKTLMATAGLLALSIAPALAADLAARPYTKAPAIAAPIYNWGGFYVGINGGGASSHNCWDLNALAGVGTIPTAAEGCHDATGGLIGGQIGYRWQASNFVFGLEAQGDWANLKGSNVSLLAPTVNQTRIDALGLFTGQVGYAWNNVLAYVKGGAAVTDVRYDGFLLGVNVDRASEDRWGGVVGAGLEFGFARGWSVALEYDHLFMGNRSLNFNLVGTGVFTRTDTIRQDVDMGTIRLNYTFGGPVVARY